MDDEVYTIQLNRQEFLAILELLDEYGCGHVVEQLREDMHRLKEGEIQNA